jgi:hypothetical protein
VPAPLKLCRVSFKDSDGIRHAAEVHAETLYEAAVLGLKALKKSEWTETLGPGTRIDIEVLEPPVQHFLLYGQLQRWLDGVTKNPVDLLKKKKLKELLAG